VASDGHQGDPIVPQIVPSDESLDVGIVEQWVIQQTHRRRRTVRSDEPGGRQLWQVDVGETDLDGRFIGRGHISCGGLPFEGDEASNEVGYRERRGVVGKDPQDCALPPVRKDGQTVSQSALGGVRSCGGPVWYRRVDCHTVLDSYPVST